MDKVLDILVLEDNKNRIKWFKQVFNDCGIMFTKDVDVMCDELRTKDYDVIFLDRDIGEPDGGKTGEDVTKIMMKEKLAQASTIIIHTFNIYAGLRMKDHLKTYHPCNLYNINFVHMITLKREDFDILFKHSSI